MIAFIVKVLTADRKITYPAIGTCSGAVLCAALDRFDGLCSVVVIPAKSSHSRARTEGAS